jgi:HSP20 family protein
MASLLMSPGGMFEDFEQFHREMDTMLESVFGPASIRAAARGSFPALNVGVGPESLDVYLLLPGLDPSKLDVSVEDYVLTVSGERSEPEQKGRAHLRERFSGAFRRAITLSDDVDTERCNADYKNGVLHISFGRKKEARARKIEIK